MSIREWIEDKIVHMVMPIYALLVKIARIIEYIVVGILLLFIFAIMAFVTISWILHHQELNH
jgi:putative effector of murein hydrolase